LHTFRITGGEPLLSPNTFKILESLLSDKAPNMNLAINTNLGVPLVLFNRFLKLIEKIENENCVKEFQLFTSIDAFGSRAEYIRNGLKTDLFWSNFEKILTQNTKTSITIMCTFNALSVTSFSELFEKVVELNKKFRNELRHRPVLLDIAYLRNPAHQTIKVLPENYIESMQNLVELIEKHNEQVDFLDEPFYNLESIKIKRLLDWMKEPVDFAYKKQLQRDFYLFFKEHDRRRETSFVKNFPEMVSFWMECEKLTKFNQAKKTIFLLENYLSNILKKLKISQKNIDLNFKFR
jgi:organic radical activating enzyme